MSRELRCERLVQAPPARVSGLFTSPAGQREFCGGDAPGWVADSRCELRAGGAWEIAFGPSPGELYRHRHVFEAIERPRRLLLATTGTRPGGSGLAFSTEFTFAPRDGATLMTMIQRGFPSGGLRDEHGRGAPDAFGRLERARQALRKESAWRSPSCTCRCRSAGSSPARTTARATGPGAAAAGCTSGPASPSPGIRTSTRRG